MIKLEGTIWVVYHNGKRYDSFTSESGAAAFLQVLERKAEECSPNQ